MMKKLSFELICLNTWKSIQSLRSLVPQLDMLAMKKGDSLPNRFVTDLTQSFFSTKLKKLILKYSTSFFRFLITAA